MKKQIQSLVDVTAAFGNPFEDDCPELLVLNSRDCADESVIATVRPLKTLEKLRIRNMLQKLSTVGKL